MTQKNAIRPGVPVQKVAPTCWPKKFAGAPEKLWRAVVFVFWRDFVIVHTGRRTKARPVLLQLLSVGNTDILQQPGMDRWAMEQGQNTISDRAILERHVEI